MQTLKCIKKGVDDGLDRTINCERFPPIKTALASLGGGAADAAKGK